MPSTPRADAGDLQTALSSVARAIADSLEQKEVWDRVAVACRAVVPFDGMGVSRLEPSDLVHGVRADRGDRAGDGAVRLRREKHGLTTSD